MVETYLLRLVKTYNEGRRPNQKIGIGIVEGFVMDSNIIVVKSKDFAVKIVSLYKHLTLDKKEHVLSQQLLKCGTGIGANIHAAVCSQGTTDFAAKMKSALSEAIETEYWLELLRDTKYITEKEAESILKDCVELIKILVSITKIVKPNK